MPNLSIPLGSEIKQNRLLENSITIRIPNTRFWVVGEKNAKKLWDVYVIDPNTNRRTMIRSNSKTSEFALFSNVILKTPFPIGKKELEFNNVINLIRRMTQSISHSSTKQ